MLTPRDKSIHTFLEVVRKRKQNKSKDSFEVELRKELRALVFENGFLVVFKPIEATMLPNESFTNEFVFANKFRFQVKDALETEKETAAQFWEAAVLGRREQFIAYKIDRADVYQVFGGEVICASVETKNELMMILVLGV